MNNIEDMQSAMTTYFNNFSWISERDLEFLEEVVDIRRFDSSVIEIEAGLGAPVNKSKVNAF